MGKTDEMDNSTATAQARKRRMQRRSKQDGEEAPEKKPRLDDDVSSGGDSSDEDSQAPPSTLSKDALAKIPGVKQQARYVPAGVKMTKQELTLWRKEARRVRNRESAAASRQKTQKRIAELEEEVGELTTKYQAALQRIVELEAQAASGSAWKSPRIAATTALHPCASPVVEPHPVSPPLSPRDDFSLEEEAPAMMMNPFQSPFTSSSSSSSYHPHPITATTCKISRPNAVKITPVAANDVDTTTTTTMTTMTTPHQHENGLAPPPHEESTPWTTLPPQDTAGHDFPLAMDDMELGDFLRDAMTAEGEYGHPDRHTDALCIFEELAAPAVRMAPAP